MAFALLEDRLTTHPNEARPGAGYLDCAVFLRQLGRLDDDTPLMLEHLPGEEDYVLAADHIRGVAEGEGISL